MGTRSNITTQKLLGRLTPLMLVVICSSCRPDLGPKGYKVSVKSFDADSEEADLAAGKEDQGEWDGTTAGASNLRGGN